MVKTFNEYYGGGIRVGGADSIVPTASLGDGPPKVKVVEICVV